MYCVNVLDSFEAMGPMFSSYKFLKSRVTKDNIADFWSFFPTILIVVVDVELNQLNQELNQVRTYILEGNGCYLVANQNFQSIVATSQNLLPQTFQQKSTFPLK